MNARPIPSVLLALALILAPLGICLGDGMAVAAPAHASGMHHAPQPAAGHWGHSRPGKQHFCPDCQPPSFVKAGKTAPPDVAPSSTAVAPAVVVTSLASAATKPHWIPSPSARAPPLRKTYRIRLQI